MATFLDTVESVPDGQGFAYFGPEHRLWLGIAVAVWVALALAYRHAEAPGRRTMRLAVAWSMVADEGFKQACLIIGGHWWANYLPLQLCSLSLFVCLWHALSPDRLNRELIYCVALPGALAALLLPGWARVPAWTAQAIHSFSVHILLAGYPIMQLAAGELKPNVRMLPACLGTTAAAAFVVYFLNKALDTNFMFLANPGDAYPMTAWRAALGNPGYLVPLIAVVVAVISAWYLPWVIKGLVEWLRRKSAQ